MQLEGKVALVTGAAGGIGRVLVDRLERRDGGAIVNVASSAGLGFAPYDGAPEYAAAKAGVMRLTACLASLAERGNPRELRLPPHRRDAGGRGPHGRAQGAR